MKKNYLRFFIIAFTAFTFRVNAQCTSGCTTTVSAADGAPHVITSGQTFCVTAAGSLSGPVVVQTGGTLCNSGTITSDIYVMGGTLNNYGSINSGNIQVDTQGDFFNYGIADIDSLLITGSSSAFLNDGTLTGIRFAITANAAGTNNGTITEDFMGDSIGTFGNNPGANLKINYDIYNAYNSLFNNSGFVDIDRDFLNSTGSDFFTSCMISVGRDWYNSANIAGPGGPSCGGFNIVGGSYNSGTIGNLGQNVDICDAGNPPLGLDGPGGTIAGTTTYCACANACVMTGISEATAGSTVAISRLYPNPASDDLTFELTSPENMTITVEVMDMMGRRQKTNDLRLKNGLNVNTTDISSLVPGTYILVITDGKNLQNKLLFTVSR